MKILILGVLLLSGCATHQTTTSREPLVERYAGSQGDLATCVYLALETDYIDGLRMIELKKASTTRIYQEIGAYQNIRSFDISLVQETPETVRAEIRGFPTIYGDQYWENKVLPMVRSCARS